VSSARTIGLVVNPTSGQGRGRSLGAGTAALLAAESAHSRANVEVQRARDRRDAIWERAAADDIDIETAGENKEQRTENQEPVNREPVK